MAKKAKLLLDVHALRERLILLVKICDGIQWSEIINNKKSDHKQRLGFLNCIIPELYHPPSNTLSLR